MDKYDNEPKYYWYRGNKFPDYFKVHWFNGNQYVLFNTEPDYETVEKYDLRKVGIGSIDFLIDRKYKG